MCLFRGERERFRKRPTQLHLVESVGQETRNFVEKNKVMETFGWEEPKVEPSQELLVLWQRAAAGSNEINVCR